MSNLIKSAARKLNIVNVYLSESRFGFHNDFDPLMPNQLLSGQYVINTNSIELKTVSDDKTKSTQNFLKCHVQAGMRYILGEPTNEELSNDEYIKNNIAAEITAVYCVIYAITPGASLTEEETSEFGKHNVPYHVWTYWREYVQNTCNRMNLPLTTVPMLIIDVQQKNEEQDSKKQ